MSNCLLVNPGTPQAWRIELNPGLNRIGRGESNDFVIHHRSVSTHHCELTVTDTAVFLTNLDATNGTFVERVPVTEIQLYPGQHVQFGSVDMLFESDLAPVLPPSINLPATGARIITANPGPAAPPPPQPTAGLRSDHVNSDPTTTQLPQPAALQPIVPPLEIAVSPNQQSFQRGAGGAIAGGFLGMFVWYLLIRVAPANCDWFAWGVGTITGLGGRGLARYGSQRLGIVCGGIALLAGLGGMALGAQQNELFKENLSLFTLLWLSLGIITAYQIGSPKKD